MCGIVGYIGKKPAQTILLDNLRKLEYRGYDSAGIALVGPKGAFVHKRATGEVQQLEKKLQEFATRQNNAPMSHKTGEASLSRDADLSSRSGQSRTEATAKGAPQKKIGISAKSVGGAADFVGRQDNTSSLSCGIGHTRWATHGQPSEANAHPHSNRDQTIFVVHNGIIENHHAIRKTLQSKGYVFESQTDTEVIPHLLDFHYTQTNDFQTAFEETIKELDGAFAIAATSSYDPNHIYVARLSSPLVIGTGPHEHYIASDQTALDHNVQKVIFLGDYEIAKVGKDSLSVRNIQEKTDITPLAAEIEREEDADALQDFPHYMLKEIHDIPQTIESAISGRLRSPINPIKLGGLESVKTQLEHIDRIVIIACGTSYYAGMVGEYLIEEIAGIPVEVQLASEFKYRDEPFSRSTAIIAISQSGETADTIAGLEKVREYGVLTLGVVNVVGSTISRITDAGVYCHAGPEKSVASTKAFVAQVTVLTELALLLAKDNYKSYRSIIQGMLELPDLVRELLKDSSDIEKMAKKYSHYTNMLFIGRGYLFPCALEGALKLKEISYIHAEGYASGEMKHGPLAMIDPKFATVALACDGPFLEKSLSNIEEIRARKGPILAIATRGNKEIKHLTDDVLFVPSAIPQLQPIIVATVVQLFAYYVAVKKGMNVDRPRNLAKSVTVE